MSASVDAVRRGAGAAVSPAIRDRAALGRQDRMIARRDRRIISTVD
ncbi:hypothetical protein [Burkholderia territorii]|nr:hypothetical protein [Burkholderia territorii]